jgi:hypothetical protein
MADENRVATAVKEIEAVVASCLKEEKRSF